MRKALIALSALSLLAGSAVPAMAQVGVTISIPGVSIGIHQPAYPELVLVPGYPVYYAPHVPANYFFYDGLYWVYQNDRWYASSWYNGPWDLIDPDDVPLFVLRVPVGYYLHPPVYFSGWVVTAPPRWDLYWGPRWAQHRHGWNHWDHHAIPAPAPLPAYQRDYAGERYPRPDYQRVIRSEHYRYQSRDNMVRRHEPGPQRQHEREEPRRSEAMQVLPAQRTAVAQEQRPQPRQQPEYRAQPEVRPQRDDQHAQTPRREHREREQAPRAEGMQVLPQQRAEILQQRQQQQERQPMQQRQEQTPRAQQAPRPQQAGRGPSPRAEAQPFRGNGERRGGQGRQ